jgi:hypothetical protein
MPSSEQASQNSKDHLSESQQSSLEDQEPEEIYRQPAPTEMNPRDPCGPRRLAQGQMLQLQSTIGNRAVQRWMRRPVEAPRALSTGPVVVARNGKPEEDIYEDLDNPPQEGVPAGEWGSDYKKRKSYIGESYDTYKSTIGKVKERPELKSASDWGGTQIKTTITSDQLTRIVNAAGEPETTARIAPMAGQMSSAFETMGINTAPAQAAYIAHMTGETGGVLEEKEGEKHSYAPFQGRGPVQVTHEANYVQTLAYIEKRIEQLEKDIADKEKRIAKLEAQKQQGTPPEGGQTPSDPTAEINKLKAEVEKAKKQIQDLREAHSAVKGDPKKAADPKYAFLFSAAYMQMTGGVRASASLGSTAAFVGNRPEDAWVTGGNVQQESLPEGGTKNVSMTFEERRQYAAEHGLTQLEKDMKSAISRGDKKSKVYGMAVSVLGSENAIQQSNP